MASANIGASQKGRKKALDAEVNLVPFIDLLSMCICFLLMTAVWIQIGAMQIKQSHGTDAAQTSSKSYEMSVQFSGASAIQVSLKRSGKVVKKVDLKDSELSKVLAQFDSTIKTWSPIWKAGLLSSAMVTPAKDVPYGDLVATLDVLRKNQIVNLGIVPVSVR